MSDLVLTIYEEDDTTTYFAVGTAAAHANPYLQFPDAFAEAEVDLQAGSARIGRLNVRVIDKQTGATQAERFLTALLGNPAGYSEVNGRRALLAHDDGTVVLDGICAGATLTESFAGFSLALDDIRARGIKVPLFTRSTTSMVLPRGVLDGYGLMPKGGWLVPPTEPLLATYTDLGTNESLFSLNDFDTYADAGRIEDLPVHLVLTEAMRQAGEGKVRRLTVQYYSPWLAYSSVEIGWREIGETDWNWITDIRLSRRGVLKSNLFITKRQTFTKPDGSPIDVIRDVWAGRPTDRLVSPDNGQIVELVVRYADVPSETYPLHFEGTAGELLKAVLDGDFSTDPDGNPIDPKLRYDAAKFVGASALPELKVPVRLRITEPEPDLREWFEKACKALGIAPALDSLGRISPVGQRLPDESVVLPEINDTNSVAIPGWEHPITGAVTQVEMTYPRDYRVTPQDDPWGDLSAGDSIATVEQHITVRPQDSDPASVIQEVMGVQSLEIDGFLFRALGGTTGLPISGDATNETGAQIAYGRGHELIDRFAFGNPTSFVRSRRSDSGVNGIVVGDWVLDARSWAPDYASGERGRNHLCQVVSVRDLNPAWREMRLLDAAPYANPVDQPELGTVTSDADGVVSVPIDEVPAGGEARIDYAISDTVPDTGSPLWTFLGRTAVVETLESPPLPAGSVVWIRARGEQIGRRPSAWTTPVDVTLANTPRILSVSVTIDAAGVPTVSWEANDATEGVRIYASVHNSLASEPAVLTQLEDADADDLTEELGAVTVAPGQYITVEVEPWTGFAAGAVSGTAGERVRVTQWFETTDELALYGLRNVRPIPASAADKLRIGFDRGPRVASVWWNSKEFDASNGWSDDFFKDAGLIAGVQPVPAGQDWVEMSAVAANKIGALRIEPRKADGTIHPHPRIVVNLKLDPVDPKIHGWIDAKYDAGILKVFAGCNPTASALPIAYEIRADSQTGTVLQSGSFSSLAAAVAGVGGSGALTNLTPPADGKKFYFVKFTDVAGNIEWHADSVENPVKPRIRKITQEPGSTPLTAGVRVTVESPMGRDVDLKVWTNPADEDNPDLTGAPDETISHNFTAGTPGSFTHTPPTTSLTDIPVWPGRGKVIGFEAVDELGLSTGVITFTLHSWLDIVGADGELVQDAIKQPAQFASSMRPFRLVATQPGSGTYTGDRIFALDTKLAWEWDGSAWDAVTIAAGGVSYLPIVIAGSVTALEIAVGEVYARHLNVADVFLEGVSWTANSPAGGRIAWSTGTVVHNGNRYTLTAGSTPSGHTVVWWDQSSPTVFQTAADMDAVEAAGFSDVSGDRIIALNDGGTPLVVWNGTRIYGGHLTTDIIKTKHLDSITLRVGKYIESDNYVAGSDGWRLEDDTAEFNDVIVRGTIRFREDVAGEEVEFYDSTGATKIGGISATDFGGGYRGMQMTNSAGAPVIAFRSVQMGVGTASIVDLDGVVNIDGNGGLFNLESKLNVYFTSLGMLNIKCSPDTDSNGNRFLVAA